MEEEINRYHWITSTVNLLNRGDMTNETLYDICRNIATLHQNRRLKAGDHVSVPLDDDRTLHFKKQGRIGFVFIETKDPIIEPRDAIPQRIAIRYVNGEFVLYRHGRDDQLKKTNQGSVRLYSMANDLWNSYLASATKRE